MFPNVKHRYSFEYHFKKGDVVELAVHLSSVRCDQYRVVCQCLVIQNPYQRSRMTAGLNSAYFLLLLPLQIQHLMLFQFHVTEHKNRRNIAWGHRCIR